MFSSHDAHPSLEILIFSNMASPAPIRSVMCEAPKCLKNKVFNNKVDFCCYTNFLKNKHFVCVNFALLLLFIFSLHISVACCLLYYQSFCRLYLPPLQALCYLLAVSCSMLVDV